METSGQARWRGMRLPAAVPPFALRHCTGCTVLSGASEGSSGELPARKVSREQFSSQAVVLQLLGQMLSEDGGILTPLFFLDRILHTVLGWGGSDSRCFLMAWPEMSYVHEEGLVGTAPT